MRKSELPSLTDGSMRNTEASNNGSNPRVRPDNGSNSSGRPERIVLSPVVTNKEHLTAQYEANLGLRGGRLRAGSIKAGGLKRP